MEQVCIKGCPRSGTHLAEWFLGTQARRNDRFVVSSHRHRPWTTGEPKRMFLMTKDPVAWVVSMHRYVRRLAIKRSGGALNTVAVDGVAWPSTGTPDEFWAICCERLVQYRNDLMEDWLNSGANVFWCPYEAMIGSPSLILRLLNVWWKDEFYEAFGEFPENPLTDSGTSHKLLGINYYLEEHWRKEMILKHQLEIRDRIIF